MNKKTLVAGATALASVPMFASEVTLPDLGININDFLTACLGQVGSTLVIVAGGALVVLLVWKGIQWLRGKIK